MKKVINVSLAGRSFTLEEDAYNRLTSYLEHYKARLTVTESQKEEVMEEMEGRVAELFYEETGTAGRVVTLATVERVAAMLGMPDGADENTFTSQGPATAADKRLFRDPDDQKIAGICSGLSLYLDVDVTLVRVIFILALFFGSAGFWVYMILWIAIPLADTPAKKCAVRGIPPTPANMSRFTTYSR